MFSKMIMTILALAISVASFGAEEISKTKQVLNYVKEKVEVAYHGEYYFVHGPDNELSNYNNMHMPILTYKFAKNWKFSGSAEFKYTDNEADGYPNRYYRSLFSITRENLLTEKDNGIKMDVGIGRRVNDRKSIPKNYGNSRVFATFSRAIPGGIGKNSASLLTQYLYNDPKVITANTWRHAFELLPSITLQLTDKLSYTLQDDVTLYTSYLKTNPRKIQIIHDAVYSTFTYKHNDIVSPYFQLKYSHGESFAVPTKSARVDSDGLSYFVGAGCALSPKVTLTPELGTDILTSSDSKTISDKFKYVDFALYIDISF